MAPTGKSPICSMVSPRSKKRKSPKAKKGKSPKSKTCKGKQFRWTDEKDKVMIQILLEETIDGQKSENGFSSTTYQKVCKALNENENLDMEMDASIEHVRSRFRTFKSTYRKARKIHRSDSGFGWNPRTERLTADPLVWEAFLEKQSETERKEFEKFRTKVMPFYGDLAVIVGDEDEATGEGGVTGIETDEQMQAILPTTEDTGASRDSSSNHVKHDDADSTRKKRRKRGDHALGDLAEAAQRMAASMERLERPDVVKLQVELKKIPNISRSLLLQAINYLGRDLEAAHMFVGLDDDLKKDWLMMVLGIEPNASH